MWIPPPLSTLHPTQYAWILFNPKLGPQCLGSWSACLTRLLVLRMFSLSFRIAAAPVTPKLPSSSHQLSPYPPACKRAAFTATLADGSNSPAGDHATSSLITDLQRLSFLTRPLAARENNASRDTGNHGSANLKASLDSIFPVHGPFELLHCLQTGGFGSAWAAKDRGTGRLLCLKVSQPSKDRNIRRSVDTELKTFRRLAKPEKGEKGRQFVMELNRSFMHGTDVFFAMVSHKLSSKLNQLSPNFRNLWPPTLARICSMNRIGAHRKHVDGLHK